MLINVCLSFFFQSLVFWKRSILKMIKYMFLQVLEIKILLATQPWWADFVYIFSVDFAHCRWYFSKIVEKVKILKIL